MNQHKIIVPTDFTETAHNALDHAKTVAKATNAEIVLLHIISEKDPDDASARLQNLCNAIKAESGVACSFLLEEGNIIDGIGNISQRENGTLVVIGTHGIQGLAQHLFGAHIIKVVRNINQPAIIIQEDTPECAGYQKILLPVSDVENFEALVNSVIPIARWFNAEVMVYAIHHPMTNKDIMRSNIGLARSLFNKSEVNYRETEEQPTMYSAGTAKQTIAFANTWGADLIAISLCESDNKGNLNLADCERVINNEKHTAVLCAPDALDTRKFFS
jgi:nucleotide-binding universal stress UspA family protein